MQPPAQVNAPPAPYADDQKAALLKAFMGGGLSMGAAGQPQVPQEESEHDKVTRALGGVPRGERSGRPMDLMQAMSAASEKARNPERSMYDTQNKVVDDYNNAVFDNRPGSEPGPDYNPEMRDLKARGNAGDRNAMDRLTYLISNPDFAAGYLGKRAPGITPSRGQLASDKMAADIEDKKSAQEFERSESDKKWALADRKLTSDEQSEARRLGLTEQEMKNKLELGKGNQDIAKRGQDMQQKQWQLDYDLKASDPTRKNQEQLNDIMKNVMESRPGIADPDALSMANDMLRKRLGLPSADQARVTKAQADRATREMDPNYISKDKINKANADAQAFRDANPGAGPEEAIARAARANGVPEDKIMLPGRWDNPASRAKALEVAGYTDEKDAYKQALDYAIATDSDKVRGSLGGLKHGIFQNSDSSYKPAFGARIGNDPLVKKRMRNEVMQRLRDQLGDEALANRIANRYEKENLH